MLSQQSEETLNRQLEEWKSWIRRDLGAYSDPEKLLRTMKLAAAAAYGNTEAEWTLWTRRNRFTFVLRVRRRAIITPPYFGCTASSRSWRAGEDWHRGGDLPDGDFSEDLWRRMLLAILSYEVDEPVPGRWPPAVSDGLALPCASCGVVPRFDYRVTDDFWRKWVPSSARLGVVCLPCLEGWCGGEGLAEALEEVQWCGMGHTIVLTPTFRYSYDVRAVRAAPG